MKYIVLVFPIILCISCKKEVQLPEGYYEGNFYGEVVHHNSGKPSGKTHNSLSIPLNIMNVGESSIDINGIILDRNENRIEGVINVSDDYIIKPSISGFIMKEKKKVFIEGVYKAKLNNYWQMQYDVFGGYVGGDFVIEKI